MLEHRRKDFFKRNWGLFFLLISFFLDLVLINLSFCVSVWIHFGDLKDLNNYVKPIIFVNGLFLFLSVGLGIYRSRHNFSTKNLSFYYKLLVLYMTISTMAFLFVTDGKDYSRQVVIISFLIMVIFFELAFRILDKFQNYLAKRHLIGFKAIIIGTDDLALEFSRQLRDVFGHFFQIAGYVSNRKDGNPYVNKEIEPFVIGEESDLEDLISTHQPDIVFISSREMNINEYKEIYQVCKKKLLKLKVVSPKMNSVLGNSKIRDVLGISLVYESWRIYYWRFNHRIKRFFDIALIVFISPIVLPLCLFIALIIKLTSKGPVLFQQKRSLYRGGPGFVCYKFRSMYENAEELKAKFLDQNDSNGALFKIKGDPRVTPFGKLIRKFSLDEIPQFINVLKGEMSLVGPRPLPASDLENNQEIDIERIWQKQRGIIKPGITGLWQISGRSNVSYEEMLFLDLYYIEHRSILFDIEILFQTFPTMFFGKGAY